MNYKSADNSTEQNISWESNTHPASEEISRLLYTTRRSIIVFTAARYWSLSRARRLQFNSSHTLLILRLISIASSHLRPGLPSGLWLSDHPCHMSRPFHLETRKNHESPRNETFCRLMLLISLTFKYSLRRPSLKHPQSVFLITGLLKPKAVPLHAMRALGGRDVSPTHFRPRH
jgi:hypothetical protein